MATVIGTVTSVQGMAIVVDANGNRHMLQVGEVLHAGDKVITASGASVSVKLANGETVNFAEAQTVKITDNLAQVDVSDVTENAVNQAVFDAVLTALNEGRDITEVLDAPAAGEAGSDGNASFVNLDRIQTQGAAASNFDGGNGLGGTGLVGSIAPNYVYFAEATDAPTVTLVNDLTPEGFLNASEVVNGLTTARIGLPIGVEPGDVVNITHNTGAIAVTLTAGNIADGFVNVDIPVPASLEGTTLVVTASVTNQSGQVSPSASDSALVDTTPPKTPAFEGVDDVGPTQGLIVNNSTIDDNKPEIRGSNGNPGDTVTIYDNGTKLGTTVVKGDGTWTFTPTTPLIDGTHSVTVTATDPAGNTSQPSTPLNFTVDTIAPNTPAFEGVDDVGPTQGLIVNNSTIDDNKPEIRGSNGNPNDTVTIYDNGTKLGTTVVKSDGTWTFTPATPLIDGTHSVTVTATDPAGNTSQPSTPLNFTVDTIAPNTPAFEGVDDVGPTQGLIVNNSTIDDNKPEIRGSNGNPNDTVTIYDNGTKLGTTVVKADGTWTFTPATPLVDGPHRVTVTATDPAGNTSQPSTPLNFTVDTVAPNTPAFEGVDDVGTIQGVIVNKSTIDDTKPEIRGANGNPSDTVTIYDNGTKLGTTVVKGDGTWSFTPTTAMPDGSKHSIQVTATDPAGNESPKSATLEFTIDTTAPNTPAFVGVDDVGTIQGLIVNNSTIDDNKPEIRGSNGNPSDTVTIYDNGTKLGTTVVKADGTWTFTPTTPLIDGSHGVTVTATDPAGNTSQPSAPLNFLIDTVAPATAISIDANVASDGVVNLTESQSNSVPVTGTVGGDAKLGDRVVVTLNGKEYVTNVITRTDGKLGFSVNVTGADLVADSDKTVEAKITLTDIAGNTSTATDTQGYTVNTQGPAVSISIDATVAGDGVVNATEAISNNVPITGTVNGQFNVGDVVTVTLNNVDYKTTVLAGGKFSVDVKGSDLVADSDKVVEAKVTTTDQFGNSTTATDTQDYAVNTKGPAVSISIDATVAGDGVVNATEALSNNVPITGTVSGTFNVGDVVTVTVNNVDYKTTVLAGGKFNVDVKGSDLVADSDKIVEAKVTTTDTFGNSTTATDTQDYAVNTKGPAVAISIDATVAGDGVVNATEEKSNNVPITGTVSGQFNVGDVVTVTVNNFDYKTTVLAGGKFSVDVKGSDLVADSDKIVEAKVTTTDTFGNSTTATDTQDYAVNTKGPAVAISIDATVAGDGVVNATEEKSNNVPITGTVSGQFNVGDVVTVTVNNFDYKTTVLAGGKFSVDVKGSDLVADSDKIVEAKVTTTDTFGNSTTATDTQDYAVNTKGPAVSISIDATVAGDGVVNATEAGSNNVPITGTVSGQFNVGDVVTVTVNNVDYKTTVLAGGKFSVDVKGSDLVADSNKIVDAKVTTTDTFGNSTTATDTQDYTVNTQGPAVSISIDATIAGDGIVNATESVSNNVPVTGTVSGQFNVGDVVTVTVNSFDYKTTVLAGGKFSVDVKGSDLLADSNKIVDAKVTTTDKFGNSTTATDTQDYKVFTNPGLSATIALDANFGNDKDGIVNIAETQAGVKVPVTGTVGGDAKAGDTVVVTVNNVAYTTTVVNVAGKLVFSVDVLGTDLKLDGDSTIDAKVTVTDVAGNTSTATTQLTYALDLTPPVATIALDANFGNDKDGIVNIAETQAGVKVPVTGTVGGDAKAGDTVVVTVNNVAYTTTVVNVAGKLVFSVDVLGTDLKSDSDSTIDAKVTVRDAAGNTSTAVTQLTYALDLTPPVATIALDANFGNDKDGIVNIAETQAGVKVPVTGTVGGDAKAGDTVVVTVNNVAYTTTVVNVAGKLVFSVDVLGTDLKSDSDSTIDAKVTVRDAAGNTSTAVTQLTYALDLTPPVATIALDANFGNDKDGIVNIAETQAGVKVPVTGTVGGDAKAGDTVVVTVNNVAYTTTVVNVAGKLVFSVDVLGTDLKSDSDSTIDAKVTVRDAAGNTSTAVTQLTYALDLTPPVATIALDANFGNDKDGIVNIAETQAGVKVPVTGTVGGDAKAGDTVVVTVNNVAYTTTVVNVAGKLVFSVDVLGTDLKSDSDSTIDAKVTVRDAAGNTSTAVTQLTYALDLTPPVATIALDANFGNDKDGIVNIAETQAGVKVPVTGTVGGDAKAGDTVVVTVNNVAYTTTVVNVAGKLVFSVDVLGTDLKSDSDSTIDAKVTVRDAAGNTSTAVTQLTYALDLTPPVATIALDANFATDGVINIEESKAPNIAVTGTVGGDAKLGDAVVLTVNGKDYTTVVITRADGKLGFSVNVPGNQLAVDPDKTMEAKVTTVDSAGNVGSANTALTYGVDLIAPNKPTIDNIFDDFGAVKGNVGNGGVADDATPTLTGKAEAGSTVTLYDGTTKIGTALADKDGKWTFTPTADINKGLHNYTVTATDNAGNTSVPSDNYAYTLNQSPVFVTLDATASVSEDGLPHGLIDSGNQNIIATGSMGISDPNGDLQSVTLTAPTTNYTSGGVAITWSGNNTGTLIGSANGQEVVRVTIDNKGDYAVRLSGPVDHPAPGEDTLALKFGVNAKDTDSTTTGSITVNVSDDAPIATNQTITASGAKGSNIMLTLDVSGSMATKDGVNGATRLDSQVASINTLLNQYAALGGDVRVMIVTFSDGYNQKTSTWVTIAEAKQVLETLKTMSGTNYDAALDGSKIAFNAAGKIAGAQNVGYFFSDGVPNTGRDIDQADKAAWETFLKANDINEYAIGVGSGVSATQVANSMNQIAYNGATEVDANAIQVTNFAQLDAVLSQTVSTPVSGSLTDGGGFGADGGYVKSLAIEGSTYSFDSKTGALTVTGTNNSTYNTNTHELTVKTASGNFVVDMDNGKYTFTPGQPKVTLVDTTFNANGNGQDTSLPTGWFTDNPSKKIEVNPSTTYGLSSSYGNVLELENVRGDGNIYTLINPGKNDTVVLSFDYAARSGYTSGTDSAIQVLVDGKVIDTVNTKSLNMSTFSYTLTGTGSPMRVEFKSVDTNSTGGLLDNIKITTSSTTQPVDSTKVTYTLSDNDGDTSTADLTLNVAKNNTYVPTPAVAPEVGNALGSAGLLTLPGLLNVDLLNFSSRQSFTASDVNNNINNVTIAFNTLLGVTLGSSYMTFSQAVASELGLSVNYTQDSGLLGLLGARGDMVITAADGGTIDNLALNEFLSTVRVNEQLVDISLLRNFTITATDSTNKQDSETSTNLINIDLLTSADNSNIITGGNANDNLLTGTSGNDIIYGYAGNDEIRAGAGNDILRGGAGDDKLYGEAGNDILIGGKGNDTLTGGTGVDVFKWDRGDDGVAGSPARDTIADFNKATPSQGGDILDVRDLLQGENATNLVNYLHFEKSGSDTVIHISSNGGFAGDAHNASGSFNSGHTTQQIVLTGVDLINGQSTDAAIISNLLSQQKLITD